MLGNLKVNNSDPAGALMSLKQINDNTGNKEGGADFYSMVMDYNRDINLNSNIEKTTPYEPASQNNSYKNSGPAERETETRKDSDSNIKSGYSVENREQVVETSGNNDKITGKKDSQSSPGEKKNETSGSDKKELDDFIQSAAGEMLVKKITELTKGIVRVNPDDLLKKFSKLADELFPSGKRKMPAFSSFNISSSGENTTAHKSNSHVMTDFFDKLGRELVKLSAGKKGNDKVQVFSEQELKETIGAIIEDIKKGKSRIHDKADLKKADIEEVRNDKKNEITTEQLTVKKKESGNDAGFELNSGKDKNGSREGNSFHSGKAETTGRNSFEKNDHLMKAPEFRQSLQEIIDKAKISVRDSNNATFSVKLFPKDLGSVNVNLFMENGVVSGRFLVDSNDARNILLNNLGELRDQLAEAGIQVGDFNVNVNHEGERFAAQAKEDENMKMKNPSSRESEAATVQYDYNSSAAHNGHINMVI